MFKSIVWFCIILQACVALSAQTPSATPTPAPAEAPAPTKQAPPTPPADYDERVRMRDAWIAAAEMVAEKVQDEEVTAVISFAKENNILGLPSPIGSRSFEQPKSGDVFKIIPLLPADKSLTGLWAVYVNNSNVAAIYRPDARALILRTFEPISPIWFGILMIHEGNHVRATTVTKFNHKDLKLFSEHERDTYELQNRIVTKLGGQVYETFVQNLSQQVEAAARAKAEAQKADDPGSMILVRTDSYPELEEIFGPSLSTLEKDIRAQQAWLHAYFLFYERHYGERAPEQKAMLMLYSALKTGVLSPPVKK